MPWQVVDGGLMLSGQLLEWAADLEEWYREDVRGLHVSPDFGSYILLIADGYLRLAGAADEGGICAPLNETKSQAEEDEGSDYPVAVLEVLAKFYDESFRMRHASGAKEWAKRLMM